MTPDAIRELRESLGLTQTQFARRLGITRQATVSEWERGERRPRPSVVLLMHTLKTTEARR
jgi:DNA-binding transcriptional regulator YiaG